MLVNLLKFIHLLCVLGLLGSVMYCLTSVGSKKLVGTSHYFFSHAKQLHNVILRLSALVMLTGTLLVHPKYFTFHTPWIEAAYIFLLIFCLGIIFVKKQVNSSKKFTSSRRWIIQGCYCLLFIILLFIVHDAVTKTTFLNFSS